MAIVTTATLPATSSFDNAGEPSGAIRDLVLQHNNLMKQQAALALAFTSDGVLKGTALSVGTTNTLASTQCVITIAGVPVSVPAQTAQALSGGTNMTVKTLLWGIFGVDAVAAGTLTFVGAAGNATGYATEALAIAAAPAKTASKARIGYVTLTAGASDWVGGTDGLTGGSGGTIATATNYYNIASPWNITADSANAITLGSIALSAKQVGNMSGTAISA